MTTMVRPPVGDELKPLLRSPTIAWPTVGLLVASLGLIAWSCARVLTGHMEHWVAMLVNGFAIYLLFSVAHDGAHRAISSNQFVNELVGRTGIMLLLPIAPWDGVRWLHMQHHRYTNGPRDPDLWVHRVPTWLRPFTWPNVDVAYLHYFITRGGDFLRRNLRTVIVNTVLFIAVLAGLTHAGYGKEILFLWFFPSRIALLLIALVFIHMPHYPGDMPAETNVYRASTLRRGLEWFLTPVLVYQNYHLIHHLYPTAPFYTYERIFRLKYGELANMNVALQSGLRMGLVEAQPGTLEARGGTL